LNLTVADNGEMTHNTSNLTVEGANMKLKNIFVDAGASLTEVHANNNYSSPDPIEEASVERTILGNHTYQSSNTTAKVNSIDTVSKLVVSGNGKSSLNYSNLSSTNNGDGSVHSSSTTDSGTQDILVNAVKLETQSTSKPAFESTASGTATSKTFAILTNVVANQIVNNIASDSGSLTTELNVLQNGANSNLDPLNAPPLIHIGTADAVDTAQNVFQGTGNYSIPPGTPSMVHVEGDSGTIGASVTSTKTSVSLPKTGIKAEALAALPPTRLFNVNAKGTLKASVKDRNCVMSFPGAGSAVSNIVASDSARVAQNSNSATVTVNGNVHAVSASGNATTSNTVLDSDITASGMVHKISTSDTADHNSSIQRVSGLVGGLLGGNSASTGTFNSDISNATVAQTPPLAGKVPMDSTILSSTGSSTANRNSNKVSVPVTADGSRPVAALRTMNATSGGTFSTNSYNEQLQSALGNIHEDYVGENSTGSTVYSGVIKSAPNGDAHYTNTQSGGKSSTAYSGAIFQTHRVTAVQNYGGVHSSVLNSATATQTPSIFEQRSFVKVENFTPTDPTKPIGSISTSISGTSLTADPKNPKACISSINEGTPDQTNLYTANAVLTNLASDSAKPTIEATSCNVSLSTSTISSLNNATTQYDKGTIAKHRAIDNVSLGTTGSNNILLNGSNLTQLANTLTNNSPTYYGTEMDETSSTGSYATLNYTVGNPFKGGQTTISDNAAFPLNNKTNSTLTTVANKPTNV
jgi:hypothetical protein